MNKLTITKTDTFEEIKEFILLNFNSIFEWGRGFKGRT